MIRSTSTGSAGRRAGAVVAIAAAAAFGPLCAPGTAAAADSQTTLFTVNSTADERDVDLVDDQCDSDPTVGVRCTLRAAVMQGNVTAGKIKIEVPIGTYRLTVAGTGEEHGARGDLDLRGRIELVGVTPRKGSVTLDASLIGDRVIDAMSPDAILRNVVVTGGYRPSTAETAQGDFGGGGIRNVGELAVIDTRVHHNAAGRGGGLSHTAGRLVLERSVVSDNRSTAPDTSSYGDGGGGVLATSAATIRFSSIERNSSAAMGGGISALPGTYDDVNVERSLIAGNTAEKQGGGIDVEGQNRGSFRLDNSTVSGNESGSYGGGLSSRNRQVGSEVTVFEATIAGNTAQYGGGAFYYDLSPSALALALQNSILANNLPYNCMGDVKDDRALSTDNSCYLRGHGSMNSVSARLGSLADNGGPTRTHALLPGSPAIDAGGHPVWGAITDQRGQWRTSGAHARFGTPHDLGAYESNPTVP